MLRDGFPGSWLLSGGSGDTGFSLAHEVDDNPRDSYAISRVYTLWYLEDVRRPEACSNDGVHEIAANTRNHGQ
jgi:hypothetical protein